MRNPSIPFPLEITSSLQKTVGRDAAVMNKEANICIYEEFFIRM